MENEMKKNYELWVYLSFSTILTSRLKLTTTDYNNVGTSDYFLRWQDCKASLTHKTELMTKLEVQKEDMASTIDQLEKK